MTTTELIAAVLARHPHIKLAVLFGSLAAGTARPDSDLEHIGRPFNLIDLTRAGELLLGQILTHGRRVLGSDDRYAQLLRRHLMDNSDFEPFRRRILAERRRAWIGR